MYSKVIKKVTDALTYEVVMSKTLTKVLSLFTFVVLTALGAYVRIPLPFTPVPITLQTLFVMLAAAFLGANLAGLSQLSYIVLACFGMPLFTGASFGIAHLFGPTGGYLIGFAFCAYICARLIRYKDSLLWTIISFSLGSLIILLLGSLWLIISMGFDIKQAFVAGFAPFVAGDFLKVVIASLIFRKFKDRYRGF
jgi:biotin transport system substrate-specific component